MNRFGDNKIIQAWLVLVIASFLGAALAAVEISMRPTIEANKLNESKLKVPEIIGIPAARAKEVTIVLRPVNLEKNGKKIVYSVFEASLEGKIVGWVAKAKGSGYADKIELLVGFDPLVETITSILVLDQKETPGLGSKIGTPEWGVQFMKKSTAKPLTVVKTSADAVNEINAISGATISSRSVTGIINTTVEDLKGPLAGARKRSDKG
jgi:electron transport complex protein RnfG